MVCINDKSMPSMYRLELVNQRFVFYHSFQKNIHVTKDQRQCYIPYYWNPTSLRVTYIPYLKPVCISRQNYSIMQIPLSLTSTHLWLKQDDVTQCQEGHVTYTFLICGSDSHIQCKHETMQRTFLCQLPAANNDISAEKNLISFPPFVCADHFTTLSYTLVCDFIHDCGDKSDENFCSYKYCAHEFTCNNKQCVSYLNMCDLMPHCVDESDEGYENCESLQKIRFQKHYLDTPTLISFNGINRFTSVAMNSSEPCPNTHYRCPGKFNDCLPVYTRCNSMYDCLEHQDEHGCDDLTCPGFLKCRDSSVCVHSDHLCDGWPHCPLRDDELFCDQCPVHCVCQGHAYSCFQPFPAALFPRLRYLDAADSGMTQADVSNNPLLLHLILGNCSLFHLVKMDLPNLKILDISTNEFEHVSMSCFLGLENLEDLSLSNNPLTSLSADLSITTQQRALTVLDLSFTLMTELDTHVFAAFPRLQKLNLTSTSIHTINSNGFKFTQGLAELHLDGSPIKTFPKDVFKAVSSLQKIVTQNYRLCCSQFLPTDFDASFCHAPKDAISSCEDLLHSWTYRGFLWLIASLSVTGNVFCCCVRLLAKSMSSSRSFAIFVINLNVADFLMAVYIVIIGVADERFRGVYLHNDDAWKSSVFCKMAGSLSLLSGEVSALIIWLITLDRFIVLHFPFSSVRFDRKSSSVACFMAWFVGWSLVFIPLLPFASDWAFYSQTGICVPLPVISGEFKGKVYSISILIFLNFVLFLFISTGQALIYWSIQSNAFKANPTKQLRDMAIAQRLITVAVTDFMCWFPIGICGMLALAGIPISGEANVALAVFILPLNSAVNPFMYTFNALSEKRKKSSEAKLLNWLEFHKDGFFNE